MDSNRVAMFAFSMCALLLLLLHEGAQGARMLIARAQGELQPCKDVPGGIAGWDCFDPPTTPLPPCDFKHQRAGFDCWPQGPPAAKVMVVADEPAAAGPLPPRKSAAHRVDGMLPPCKDVPGGTAGWDCFDPPTTPLPPCDFKHQRAGFDCWPQGPPAAKVMVVADEPAAAGPSPPRKSAAHRVDGMLPPCKDVPGGIAGWDCFDPPTTPLPPCDFHHQRAGFDCWPKSPPAARR